MNTARAVDLFLEEYEFLAYSPKTIAHYRWALDKLRAAHKRLPTTRRPIMALISSGKWSEQTRLDLWRDYRRFWRWLSKHHQVANVMDDVPRPRTRRQLPQVLQDSDVNRVLQAATLRRDRALITLLLDTGLRSGEVATLTWPNVFSNGLLVDGKTGQHKVPLSPHVRALLVGLGDGYHIWTGERGPLTKSGIEQAVRRVIYRAGVPAPKAGPHILRHTFATLYVKSGGNVRVLQEILGHTDLKTTMIYVHLAGRDIELDHAAHSPVAYLRLLSQEEVKSQA